MDTRFFTTFLEVVNTRHFGKAAENLYLTQSAVSARIKLLEEYFHTALFIRHRNSIQLTPAGEKLLPFARQLCETLAQAKQELQKQSAEYVVCGATQLASELSLADMLSFLHQADPDRLIKAEILTQDSLTRQLHERVIDLALSSEPLKSEEVVCRPIVEQPLGLFCLNKQSASVTSTDFVAIDWGSKARDSLLTIYPQLREAKLQTNSLRLALTTLQNEGGYCVLPMDAGRNSRLLPEALLISPLKEVFSTLYLSRMKTVKRTGVDSLAEKLLEWRPEKPSTRTY